MEIVTHRLFPHVVNTVRTAVVVTCEKLGRKCEIEIGLCFGNEVCISLNDRGGFILREALVRVSLDEDGGNNHGKENRT